METAWRRYQVVRLRGQTLLLGKAPYSRLCTKDRMECGRTGAGDHECTEALSFFQSSMRKLLGDPG